MEERKLIALKLIIDSGLTIASLIFLAYQHSFLWFLSCLIWGGNVVFDIINIRD